MRSTSQRKYESGMNKASGGDSVNSGSTSREETFLQHALIQAKILAETAGFRQRQPCLHDLGERFQRPDQLVLANRRDCEESFRGTSLQDMPYPLCTRAKILPD